MIKSSLFYFKKNIKSPLLIIAVLINLFLMSKMVDVLETSLFEFTPVYYYAIISTNLFMLVSTASVMSKNYEISSFLERDKCRKMIITILTSIYISIIISILPVGAMVFLNNAVSDIYFIKNALFHFYAIWMLSNILAATIGSVVGLAIQNGFASVVAIIVYSFFLWVSQNTSSGILHRYLNIFDDSTFVQNNDLAGPIFNSGYIMDKIFILLLIILIISVAYIFYSLRKKLIYISFSCIILSLLIFLVYQGEKNQIFAKPQIATDNEVPFNIKSYEMDLNLTNNLQNNANLTVQFTKDTNEIVLLIDDLFTINELKMNKANVDFYRNENKLKIKSSFKKNQIVQLFVSYNGKVNVENQFGVNAYYVHGKTVNLPGNTFAWYPKPVLNVEESKNTPIPFKVQVKSPTSIISNINSVKGNNELLIGEAESLSLFAGNYKEIKKDNIKYIIPTSYKIDIFIENLDGTIDYLLTGQNQNISEQEKEALRKKQYNKVIVGFWPEHLDSTGIELVNSTLLVQY